MKSKSTMLCAYATCFAIVLIGCNQFAVIIENAKYVVTLLLFGYASLGLVKLPDEKIILGKWIILCVVIHGIGIADLLYFCQMEGDKEQFMWSSLLVIFGVLISVVYYSCKIIRVCAYSSKYKIDKQCETEDNRKHRSVIDMTVVALITGGVAKILMPTDFLMYVLSYVLMLFLVCAIPYILYCRFLEYYAHEFDNVIGNKSANIGREERRRLSGDDLLKLKSTPMCERKKAIDEFVKRYNGEMMLVNKHNNGCFFILLVLSVLMFIFGLMYKLTLCMFVSGELLVMVCILKLMLARDKPHNSVSYHQSGNVYWGRDQVYFIVYACDNEIKRENISKFHISKGAQLNSINFGIKREDGLVYICPCETR